jgi:hypothetical protein
MALENFRRSSRTKLNFTERKTLAQSGVIISVDPASKPLQVRINQLTLPDMVADDAQVSVEAYRSSTGHYERINFGDAAPFKTGAGVGAARPMLRIETAEGLRFRLKIVEAGSGRLIAEVDGLRAIEESDERAVDDLLPVIPKSLNGELWRVAFSPDGPELHVEKALNQEGVFLWTLSAFQALVLPAALKQVAEKLIRNRESQEDWHERWRTFLIGLHVGFAEASEPGAEEETPSDDEIEALTAELAAAFARKFELVRIGAAALREGGGE